MEVKKKGKGIVEWIIGLLLVISFVGLAVYTKGRLDEVAQMVSMEDSKLVLYEGPKTLKDATAEDIMSASELDRNFALMHSTDTTIKVNGYESYVYETNVNNNRAWSANYLPTQSRSPITYFDFEGIANIEVYVPNIELTTVKISPVSYGIEPVIDQVAHTVSFTVTEPNAYSLDRKSTRLNSSH